jgi:hypothetical protein
MRSNKGKKKLSSDFDWTEQMDIESEFSEDISNNESESEGEELVINYESDSDTESVSHFNDTESVSEDQDELSNSEEQMVVPVLDLNDDIELLNDDNHFNIINDTWQHYSDEPDSDEYLDILSEVDIQLGTSSQTQTQDSQNPLYNLYGESFDKELLSKIQSYDSKFHLSGLISYLITHNWIKQHQIIELVDTNQLWKYKEVDRIESPKGDCDLDSKCGSILDQGFFEPLLLTFDIKEKNCLLIEGNSRLAFAKMNKIPFVPVKVISAPNPKDSKSIPLIKKFDTLCASSLGFKTIQSFPEHPYLSNELASVLNSLKFESPYDLGYEDMVVKLIQPNVL